MSPRRRRKHEPDDDPIRTEELVRSEPVEVDDDPEPDPDTDAGVGVGAGATARDGGDGTGAPADAVADDADRVGDRPPSHRRAAAGRVLALLLLAGAVTGLILGAARLPGGLDLSDRLGPPAPEPVAAATVDPRVSESVLSCPGPEQVGLQDATVEEQRMVVQASAAAAPEEALPEDLSPAPDFGSLVLETLPEGPTEEVAERGTRIEQALEDASAVRVAGSGELAAGTSGAQWHLSRADQRRGLTGAPCIPATTESWLLAGGDEPGRVERIVLVNPGGNAVTVRVQVFGGEGELPAPGGQGIVLEPGGRTVLLLDALASGEATPAIRVTSSGGPVAAALGDRWLEGTLDRGLELTVPAALPSTELVVPAVPLPLEQQASSAQLRVVVPGDSDAILQVRALTEDGPVRIEQDVTVVSGGTVADIDVSDVPPGTQGLQVTSDVPVTAAARVERRSADDAPSDMAWVPATEPVRELAGVPLAEHESVSINSQLVLAAVEPAEVEVVTVGPDGEIDTQSVSVPAASVARVPVRGAASVWVRPLSGTPHAAVVAFDTEAPGGTLLAGVPLQDLPVTRDLLDVLPWRP